MASQDQRTWSRTTERRSLRHPERLMRAAMAAYGAIADTAYQLQLADEAAETRGPELTLAFRNVVMVAAGYRTVTAVGADGLSQSQAMREPCVVFVVRRKWKSGSASEKGDQCIPRRLMAYAQVGGQRILVAIPTDVQVQTKFSGARALGPRALHVDDQNNPEFGMPTCAVAVGAEGAQKRYILSARHVLSPRPDLDAGVIASGVDVAALDGATLGTEAKPFGITSEFGGELRSDGEPSFDVQLIQRINWPRARKLLRTLKLAPTAYVDSPAALFNLPGPLEILVPENHPDWLQAGLVRPVMQARVREIMPSSYGFDHDVISAGQLATVHLVFWRLLCLELVDPAIDTVRHGDSGSAVIARGVDGLCTLVGMLIASNDDFAFAIPAWQLFDSSYYWNLPAQHPVAITPVDP